MGALQARCVGHRSINTPRSHMCGAVRSEPLGSPGEVEVWALPPHASLGRLGREPPHCLDRAERSTLVVVEIAISSKRLWLLEYLLRAGFLTRRERISWIDAHALLPASGSFLAVGTFYRRFCKGRLEKCLRADELNGRRKPLVTVVTFDFAARHSCCCYMGLTDGQQALCHDLPWRIRIG